MFNTHEHSLCFRLYHKHRHISFTVVYFRLYKENFCFKINIHSSFPVRPLCIAQFAGSSVGSTPSNVAIQLLTLLSRVREVPCWNLDTNNGFIDRSLVVFLSHFWSIRDKTSTSAYFNSIRNPLFSHLSIRNYISVPRRCRTNVTFLRIWPTLLNNSYSATGYT